MEIVVVGGGAAGFFAAIHASKHAKVTLLEKTNQLLTKVRISGGGRCNVTHHCFDPKKLVHNYPRGEKELLSPFMRFQPRDTIAWFEERGVPLKTEEDGRMFPVTDSSKTISDLLLKEAEDVTIRLQSRIVGIVKEGERFVITLATGEQIGCDRVLLATGSAGYNLAKSFGHTIVDPVPSLFTFNVPSSPLLDLAGVSVADVEVCVLSHKQRGPLLLTHWGFSGPCVLKLSAFAARDLHACDYQTSFTVNWVPAQNALHKLLEFKNLHPSKQIGTDNPFHLPRALWKKLVPDKRLSDCSQAELSKLAERLQKDSYQLDGKTTNKEEFVTCGGISLREVNFKTMESKLVPHLYFAGEILDIDGITGGFNFQNAWTTGWIAGHAMTVA